VKFETPQADALVVTYDDEKTTLAKIIQALKKGGINHTGKPVYLN
jgi:copper chaperone CopZ